MAETIFTKIIKGVIPAHKIYEDDKTLAFLDIRPVQPGHTLVIPKNPIDHLWDLPDEDYQAVMATCKKVALRLRDVLGVARVGVKVMGEEVPHAHVQLIPFNTISQYNSPPNLNADQNELAEMAKKLAF
jgi:histidine triad (HIT) family protein